MTLKDLENKLAQVEKGFTEMQDVVRRLSKDNSNSLELLSKVNQEVLSLQAANKNLKTDLENLGKAYNKLNQTNY